LDEGQLRVKLAAIPSFKPSDYLQDFGKGSFVRGCAVPVVGEEVYYLNGGFMKTIFEASVI
jgi:hypothetical protein